MHRIAITYGNVRKAEPYAAAIAGAGAEPVLVSAHDGITALNGYAGLLLSGGTDVNSKLYGQPAHRNNDHPDDERDAMELKLLRLALELDLPVLGICRGMQLFNVAHPGGRLLQHVQGHVFRPPDPSEPAHLAILEPGTRLAGIIREGELLVNSRHHQAVAEVGGGLTISARAQDGVIEGLERPDRRFAMAVQWHPEDQVRDPSHRRLFDAFVRVCAEVRR